VGSEGKSAVAWRGDRLVYYSCGNTGGGFDPGDWARLTANLCLCPAEPYGACCDPDTAVCADDLSQSQCEAEFHADQTCAALEPPCGDPGACCDDSTGTCVDEAPASSCAYRAVSGTLCADITPPCGGMVSVLYAPSNADTPEFRSELAALVGGPVDYFNAHSGTPTLDQLLQYDCVLVWSNLGFADYYTYGTRLAQYVDAGGCVILGQSAYAGFSLTGTAPILDPQYCPVDVFGWDVGSYAGDGQDCVHVGVTTYGSIVDLVTLRPGAQSDGTFGGGRPAVAWRPDRRVYYSPGNMGGYFGTGDWARLTANMCLCQVPHIVGDLNCDGVINGYDIDPFVLALTSPAEYAAQFVDCDYMLADCNGDGEVNGYDIDPFVDLLVSP
jgi:hypothetical protein